MKRTFVALLAMLLVVQVLPMVHTAVALSKADFTPKRRSFCEIFVEPN